MSRTKPTSEEKLHELINMYYTWREKNKLGGPYPIHSQCESINNLWDKWVKRNHEDRYEELSGEYRRLMNKLTGCYTIVEEQERLEQIRKEMRESF